MGNWFVPRGRSQLGALTHVLIAAAVVLAGFLLTTIVILGSVADTPSAGAGGGDTPLDISGFSDEDGVAEGSIARACLLARAAVNRGDADEARATLEALDLTEDQRDALPPGCKSLWILAAALAPEEPEAEDSAPTTFGEAWDGFVEDHVTPLAGAGAFLAGGWLALFVLARLLVELPQVRDLTSDTASRRDAALLGWMLLAAVPLVAVLLGTWTGDGSLVFGIGTWISLAALALIGAVALAAWLATIRSLTVVVKAPEGDADLTLIDSSGVVAQLKSLAGGRTKSIELPAGPAVSEVSTALTELSSAAWVAVVQKITLYLVGVVPWTATVVVASETDATVTVTRNRATKGVAFVNLQGTGYEALAKPPAEVTKRQLLIVFVAAEILLELRNGYPDEFDPDLYGATSAPSIALQYIATRWYTTKIDAPEAKALLAASLRLDPYNELARYSLDYVTNRGATDVDQLVAFGARLDESIGPRTRNDELLQGMVLTRAAAARNLAAAALKLWRATPSMASVGFTPRAQAAAAIRTSLVQLGKIHFDAESDDRKERIAAHRLAVTKQALEAAHATLMLDAAPPIEIPPIAGDTIEPVAPVEPGTTEPAAAEAIETALTATPLADTQPVGPATAVNGSPEIEAVHRAEASLAYSLAGMLVCWNRAPIRDERVASLLRVALLVPVYREFAEKDPELTAGEGLAEWLEEFAPVPAAPPAEAVEPTPPADAVKTP